MTPEEIAAEAARVAAAGQETQKTPEQIAAEETASRQNNADNAARRVLETAQARIAELEAAEQKRKDAELSEVDRLKKEAADNKQAADNAKLEALRLKAGKGLPDEALEFLTGTDADTLAAQATKLAALYGNAPAAPKPPVQVGNVTQPAANQAPSAQEKIAAAVKSGDVVGSIRLMREAQFGDKTNSQ